MIQLFVANNYLDIAEGTSFGYVFNNSIFGLDKTKLSRSTGFTLPATPKNNSVFGFGTRADRVANGTRNLLSCSLLYSGGKIDGTLYVEKCSPNEYECCFVYGTNTLMTDWKNTKLKDYLYSILENQSRPQQTALDLNVQIKVDATYPSSVPSTLGDFVVYKYKNDVSNVKMPTVSLDYLVKLIHKKAFNADMSGNVPDAKKIGIKLNGDLCQKWQQTDGTLSGNSTTMSGLLTFDSTFSGEVESPITSGEMVVVTGGWKIEFDGFVNLTTTQAFTADINGVVLFSSTGSVKYRYFNTTYNTNVSVNDLLVTEGDFLAPIGVYYTPTGDDYDWLASNISTFNRWGTKTEISSIGTAQSYNLSDNLPDCKVAEIIKTEAALTGTSPIIANNTIVWFDWSTWATPIPLDNELVKIKQITRTFGDYSSQNNVIKFKSSDNVPDVFKVTKSQTISNYSLGTDESTIYEIPFSEGSRDNVIDISYIPDVESEFVEAVTDTDGNVTTAAHYTFELGKDKDTIVMARGSEYLQQPTIATNAYKQAIVSLSTQIDCVVKMPLFRFMAIAYNSTFTLQGKKYLCVSAKWKSNEAEMQLQQMA